MNIEKFITIEGIPFRIVKGTFSNYNKRLSFKVHIINDEQKSVCLKHTNLKAVHREGVFERSTSRLRLNSIKNDIAWLHCNTSKEKHSPYSNYTNEQLEIFRKLDIDTENYLKSNKIINMYNL